MAFKPTQNIDIAFRSMRAFMLLVVLSSAVICLYALYKNAEVNKLANERMYVLAGDKALEAFASSRKDNLAVEARDHIRMFHTAFFSLDPDEKAIHQSIRKALYLADGTAKKQYDDLVETGYISGMISGNVSQQISIDSVTVNTSIEPYSFRCFAMLKIIRPTSLVTRNLITQGRLRNIARTDNNPHGFLIERWEILENKDMKIETR